VCLQERTVGDAKRYNDIIRHETLRVAVCDMLEGLTPCPDSLRSEHNVFDHYRSSQFVRIFDLWQRISMLFFIAQLFSDKVE